MGFFQRSDFTTSSALISQLVTDLKANGFNEINAAAEGDNVILEATIAVDPLVATQPWRIALGEYEMCLSMRTGTSDQLTDTGEITHSAILHTFCPWLDITERNMYGYMVSITDHGVAVDVYPMKETDHKATRWITDWSIRGDQGYENRRHSQSIKTIDVLDDQYYMVLGYNDYALSRDGYHWQSDERITEQQFYSEYLWNGISGVGERHVLFANRYCYVSERFGLSDNEYNISHNDANWYQVDMGSSRHVERVLRFDNKWVAIGGSATNNQDYGYVWTSEDEYYWTGRFTTATSYMHMMDATVADGYIVACGRSNSIHRSIDGITWETIQPAQTHNYRYFDSIAWNEEIGAGSVLVACGNYGIVMMSTDNGETWTTVDMSAHMGVGTNDEYRYIEWDAANSRFVMFGNTGTLTDNAMMFTSPDGTNWTKIDMGIVGRFEGMTKKGNRIVAVGREVMAYSDDDGATWTENTRGGAYRNYNNWGTAAANADSARLHLNDGMARRDVFAYNYNGRCGYSTDGGKTFKNSYNPSSSYFYDVVHNGKFDTTSRMVAATNGAGHILMSSDQGATWEYKYLGAGQSHSYAVGYANGTWLVSFGNGNYIARSVDEGETWTWIDPATNVNPNLTWVGNYVIDFIHNGRAGSDGIWYASTSNGYVNISYDGGVNWEYAGNLGRRYARLERDRSGSHNPIVAATNYGIEFYYDKDTIIHHIGDGKYSNNSIEHNLLDNSIYDMNTVTPHGSRYLLNTTGDEVYVTTGDGEFRQLFEPHHYQYSNGFSWTNIGESQHFCNVENHSNRSFTNSDGSNVRTITPRSSFVCIQRPVDKETGVVITEGSTPLVQWGSDSTYGYVMSVIRTDVETIPTPYTDVTAANDMLSFPLPMFIGELKTNSAGNHISIFPYGISTETNFYPYELDMVGLINYSLVSALGEVDLTMYGDTTPRVFVGLPTHVNVTNQRSMSRPVMVSDGGGV